MISTLFSVIIFKLNLTYKNSLVIHLYHEKEITNSQWRFSSIHHYF